MVGPVHILLLLLVCKRGRRGVGGGGVAVTYMKSSAFTGTHTEHSEHVTGQVNGQFLPEWGSHMTYASIYHCLTIYHCGLKDLTFFFFFFASSRLMEVNLLF